MIFLTLGMVIFSSPTKTSNQRGKILKKRYFLSYASYYVMYAVNVILNQGKYKEVCVHFPYVVVLEFNYRAV